MPPPDTGAPPWWPDGEEWPPADWRMARRRFVPRMAALMLGLIFRLGVCVMIGVLFWAVATESQPPASADLLSDRRALHPFDPLSGGNAWFPLTAGECAGARRCDAQCKPDRRG